MGILTAIGNWFTNLINITINGFKNIADFFLNFPNILYKNIIEPIVNFFNNLFNDFWNKLIKFFKDLFIPKDGEIQKEINNLKDKMLKKFNIRLDGIKLLFSNDKPVSDINENYNIPGLGTFNLKFFDAQYLIKGVEYFRPVLRGFIVLLALLFNYNQLCALIGAPPISIVGIIKNESEK